MVVADVHRIYRASRVYTLGVTLRAYAQLPATIAYTRRCCMPAQADKVRYVTPYITTWLFGSLFVRILRNMVVRDWTAMNRSRQDRALCRGCAHTA